METDFFVFSVDGFVESEAKYDKPVLKGGLTVTFEVKNS